MIGIKDISSYVPKKKKNNFEQAAKFGEDEAFIRDRIGAEELAVKSDDEDTSDLAVNAVNVLLEKSSTSLNDIECVVLCTQNPDGSGLPHTSAIVLDKLNAPSCIAAFDISLGCSGYVYGLMIAKGFMEAAGFKKGILVTADPYSKIVDSEDKNTAILFGDAASATLLTDTPVYEIGRTLFGTDGSGRENLINNDGVLYMNGRQVFNFAATKVPAQIKELLEQEKLEAKDVDLFLLHQGSAYIVNTIARRLKAPVGKVPLALKNTGNTVSSSIPLMLEGILADESVEKIILSGFGVGLSWASTIINRI